jgi:hypothetical protein
MSRPATEPLDRFHAADPPGGGAVNTSTGFLMTDLKKRWLAAYGGTFLFLLWYVTPRTILDQAAGKTTALAPKTQTERA